MDYVLCYSVGNLIGLAELIVPTMSGLSHTEMAFYWSFESKFKIELRL